MIKELAAVAPDSARPAVTDQVRPSIEESRRDTPAVTGPGAVTPAASQKNGKQKTAKSAGVFKSEKGMRVTKAGAVIVDYPEKLRAIPLFYYSERGQWFFGDGRGSFSKVPDSNAKAFVALYGFSKSFPDDIGITKAEMALMWLMQNHRVVYAGPLAGYKSGIHEISGTKILVTESPVFITPKAGDCSTIRILIESMFFEEDKKQIAYFYLWLSKSFAEFNARMFGKIDPNKFRHCPALAIFGPKGCGKSALIDLVIAPLLGGKKADPMNYLRDPKFNKD